jgi:hypothetical protein
LRESSEGIIIRFEEVDWKTSQPLRFVEDAQALAARDTVCAG